MEDAKAIIDFKTSIIIDVECLQTDTMAKALRADPETAPSPARPRKALSRNSTSVVQAAFPRACHTPFYSTPFRMNREENSSS